MAHTFLMQPNHGEINDRLVKGRFAKRTDIRKAAVHFAKLFQDGETGQLDVSVGIMGDTFCGDSAHVFRVSESDPVTVEILNDECELVETFTV